VKKNKFLEKEIKFLKKNKSERTPMINRKQLYDTCKKAKQVFYQQKLQGEPYILIWYDKVYTEKWIQLVPQLNCEVLYPGTEEREEKEEELDENGELIARLDDNGMEIIHIIEAQPSLLKLKCKDIHTYLGKTKKIKEFP